MIVSDSSTIAVIGAGQMGMPMVHRLVRAGRRVVVHARRSEVRDECEAAGATATADLRLAVRDADVVVICLYSDAQVRELALGPDGFLDALREGGMVIVHTTGSPTLARILAEHGASRDLHVVEAPVSGTAQDIIAGRLTVLLAGDPNDVEAARQIVCAYGDPLLTMGALGSAQAVKLLNNALFAAQLQLAGEVERIAAEFGVDIGQAVIAIQRSSGASFAMGVVERMGSVANVVTQGGHFLQKDVSVVDEVATELGIDLGVLGYVNHRGPLTFTGRPES